MTTEVVAGSGCRTACSECQRRKQKCDRQWPCNHCQKRKVPDQCRFRHDAAARSSSLQQVPAKKKRTRSPPASVHGDEDASPLILDCDDIESLGYAPSHPFIELASRLPPHKPHITEERSSLIEEAIRVFPARPYIDLLTRNFFDHVNYHYYVLEPRVFLDEYQQWWADRIQSKSLDMEWTSLLLIVCACSLHHLPLDMRQRFQCELAESPSRLSTRCFEASQRLGNAIPAGQGSLTRIQQLIHVCSWQKSEGDYIACWHTLNSAIRWAQELSMRQPYDGDPNLTDFERQMRRRAWCVLDTWDWQISAMLSRPIIINRNDCFVGLPSAAIQGNAPSPILHMRLQRELITIIFERFGDLDHNRSPKEALEQIEDIKKWMQSFPSTFNIEEPDTSKDNTYPWIALQRHYLHIISYASIVSLTKPFLARRPCQNESIQELQLKHIGIDYSLQLMDCLTCFFNSVYPNDARFHSLLFSLFDTAALFCSALAHDEGCHLPRRSDMLEAIASTLSMLGKMAGITKSISASHNILLRLVKEYALFSDQHSQNPNKRAKMEIEGRAASLTRSKAGFTEIAGEGAGERSPSLLEDLSRYYDIPSSAVDFNTFFDGQLPNLGTPWHWEALDLDFSAISEEEER
ncbi:hypothetical protein BX600DRAFT_387814 [Xylariales sp. PMI_506]|nr:hypothetical protein BX600DRAFT_387814 [Xylariales sp. PMI_506]